MVSADELRQVMRSLPEAEERETWGHPTFRVRDKMFATMSDDGRQATVKATKEEQAALVAAAPETFGIPAYVGRHGWVSIQLATVDPAELRELVVEAWRQSAPTPGHGLRLGVRVLTSVAGPVTWGRGSMRAWLPDPVRFR
jgi:hypothetical protein